MRKQYSLQKLQSIADQYDAIGMIQTARLFTSGFENSNYLIETEKGRFVTKVFEGMGISGESVVFEVEAKNACAEAGIKTPRLFRAKSGRLISRLGEKYVVLMEFEDTVSFFGL